MSALLRRRFPWGQVAAVSVARPQLHFVTRRTTLDPAKALQGQGQASRHRPRLTWPQPRHARRPCGALSLQIASAPANRHHRSSCRAAIPPMRPTRSPIAGTPQQTICLFLSRLRIGNVDFRRKPHREDHAGCVTWSCFAQEALKSTPPQSSLLAISCSCISRRKTYRKSVIPVLENAASACLFASRRGMTDAIPSAVVRLLQRIPVLACAASCCGCQIATSDCVTFSEPQVLALLMPHPGLVRRSACSRSMLTSRSPDNGCLQHLSMLRCMQLPLLSQVNTESLMPSLLS